MILPAFQKGHTTAGCLDTVLALFVGVATRRSAWPAGGWAPG